MIQTRLQISIKNYDSDKKIKRLQQTVKPID